MKKTTPPRPAGDKIKISPNVKVILKQIGQLDAGSKQVLMQNIRAAGKAAVDAKALKAANQKTKALKSKTNVTRGQISKMSPMRSGRVRGGGAGGLGTTDIFR
jgi:N-acetyl-beta-hexosaminidase